MVDRIPSTQTPCEIAEKQRKELARLSELADELCVIGADCGHTQLKPQAKNQFAEPTALGEEGGPDEQEEHEGKIGEHEVDILISTKQLANLSVLFITF